MKGSRRTAHANLAERGPLHGVTLLLVEDHPDSADATRLCLESLGARVLLARDGAHALDVLKTLRPDAILADLRVPGIDGFELCARVHRDAHFSDLPVVALTGMVSAADYHRTADGRFAAHLAKPLDMDQVCATVLKVVAKHGAAGRSEEQAWGVVAALVQDLDPQARLVELTKIPEGYAAQLVLPDEVGKSFTIPAPWVDQAGTNPKRRAALRRWLRSAVLTLRGRRSVADSRETLTSMATSSRCPACKTPITRRAPVTIQQGELWHRQCAGRNRPEGTSA